MAGRLLIDFKPVLLLREYVREPRAQYRFWGAPLLLTVDPSPRPRRALERFRDWLGCDPSTMDRDDVFAALVTFRDASKRKRRKCPVGPQQHLPTVATKVSKPRSMGLMPTGAERRSWVRGLRLPVFPATRGDCPETRPCTFVRCRYHLKVEIDQDAAKRLDDGSVIAPLKDLFPMYRAYTRKDGTPGERYVYPGMPLEQMPATCALDVAHERPHTLEQVGAFLSVVQERARQELDEAIEEFAVKMGIETQEAIFVLRIEGQRYQREK